MDKGGYDGENPTHTDKGGTMQTRSVLIAVLTLVLSGPVPAADSDTVEGSYMVDGNPVQLKYAYAVKDEARGITYESALFSAAPISAEDLKSDDYYLTFSDRASAGEVQALQVIFTPHKTIKEIFIYDKAIGGALQTNFGELEVSRFDSTGVTGKIIMDTPARFIDQTFQYNISFNVNWAAP
jgi:hypothetical protein